MVEQVFIELGTIVIATTLVAGIGKMLRQPMIISYIVAGLLMSPYGLNVVNSHDTIGTFSQLGIALLLFMVGLNMSPKVIKTVGKISVITGLGQILFTSVIGFTIAWIMNFTLIESLYISVALTFSSTIVIMKLLSDKKDLDTLYGRIAMGFLIVQDIVAMFILIFVASFGSEGEVYAVLIESLIKVAGSIGLVLWLGYYVLPTIFRKVADSVEFLVLFSIAWCLFLAIALHHIGLSIEIGALLAGVSLSVSPFRHQIISRVKPLRDFFLLMFFVFLWTQMEFSNFQEYTIPIIIFSTFILIGNPIIVMTLMGLFKYTKRTGFMSGLTVAQISEFSLILIALGIKMGHIQADILSLVTVTGLVTISGSSYLIIYNKKIFTYLSPYLNLFERKTKKVDDIKTETSGYYDAAILGYNNHVGKTLTQTLRSLQRKFIVIDHDPDVIHKLISKKIPCLFKDVEDGDVFDIIHVPSLRFLISSIKHREINVRLIKHVRMHNPECIIIPITENLETAMEYYHAGADYVVVPNELTGGHISGLLQKDELQGKTLHSMKMQHMKLLQGSE